MYHFQSEAEAMAFSQNPVGPADPRPVKIRKDVAPQRLPLCELKGFNDTRIAPSAVGITARLAPQPEPELGPLPTAPVKQEPSKTPVKQHPSLTRVVFLGLLACFNAFYWGASP